MGGIVKGVGNAVGGLVGGAGNLLLGKKDPGQAAQTIDMATPEQKAGQAGLMGKFQGIANQDYGQMAQNQTNQAEAQAIQNSKDMTNRAQQMVAQRGLGNTSMGMNEILGQQQNLGNEIGGIRSQRLGLQNQLQQQGLGFAAKGMSDIWNTQQAGKIYQPGVASKGRQGGLMPIIGGVAGGVLGSVAGPMGTAAGAQAGMGLGNMFTQLG
jgi:hypothetical protein